MLCVFLQIRCYHDSKTHAGIISNAGITFSGYDESEERVIGPGATVIVTTSHEGGGKGGSVIKIAPVMGLITLIVSNTWLSFQMLLPRPEERHL